jgi:CRISPR-associated protein Csb2
VIHGVALAFPSTHSPDDREVLDAALRRWAARSEAEGADGLILRMGGRQAVLDDTGSDRGSAGVSLATGRVLQRSYWSRASDTWTSVTPVALDRFPGRWGDAGWEDRASEIIADACGHVGLPRPEEVRVVWSPPMVGVPAAGPVSSRSAGSIGRFGGFRAGTSGQVRLCVHTIMRFAGRVAGPVVVGAGRFSGYGLCLPTPGPDGVA